MDSGRKSLLEKAREFGSLAQIWSINELLDRTITYRTLAVYLGIQTEWWEEFWRSFYFALSREKVETVKRFRWCCNAKSLPFVMNFLSNWFGKGVRVSQISAEEFAHVYHLLMREDKNSEIIAGDTERH